MIEQCDVPYLDTALPLAEPLDHVKENRKQKADATTNWDSVCFVAKNMNTPLNVYTRPYWRGMLAKTAQLCQEP